VVAEVLLLRALRRSTAPYLLYSAQNIRKRYPLPFRWFERPALANAHAVYVCNDEAGEIVREKGLAGTARYLPLGVRLELFSPAEREAPAQRAAKTIGYVGRLEAHKGVHVLLETVARHADWRLEVTGDGPQRGELEALARRLGIADRVAFLGFASGAELADRYRALDVVAVPSLPTPGWLEQFCRVAVEAMACGVPVVGSASGAIPTVLGDAGLTAAPGDVDAWDERLAQALEPKAWRMLRDRGLARAGRFSWASVAREQRDLYDELLPQAPPRRAPHVLVVAYGDPAPLGEALAALGPDFAVTVVDNSSLPETRSVALAHGASYLDAGGNLGFAGGVNLGLADIAARGHDGDVLLLNPDARIGADGVRAMQARLARESDLAAVGATQREPGSDADVRVWWPFPTPWGAWIEAAGLGSLRRSRDFAIGSVLLLRAEALAQLGRLDERFFLYAEETDWQYRARRAGWRIAVADVVATHEGGGTGGDPRVREGHFYGSAERYVRKHYGALGWQAYRAANVAGAGLRAIALPGARGESARRRFQLFTRGPVRVEEAMR